MPGKPFAESLGEPVSDFDEAADQLAHVLAKVTREPECRQLYPSIKRNFHHFSIQLQRQAAEREELLDIRQSASVFMGCLTAFERDQLAQPLMDQCRYLLQTLNRYTSQSD